MITKAAEKFSAAFLYIASSRAARLSVCQNLKTPLFCKHKARRHLGKQSNFQKNGETKTKSRGETDEIKRKY